MKILGITMGVTSTAAAMIDGEIVACVSEERFNGKKNYDGYPEKSVEFCASFLDSIDKVVIALPYNVDPAYIITQQESNRSVLDWIKEQKEYWYPKLYQGVDVNYIDVFKNKIDLGQFPGHKFWQLVDCKSEERIKKFVELRKKMVSDHLELPLKKAEIIEHHLAHSMYAFYRLS